MGKNLVCNGHVPAHGEDDYLNRLLLWLGLCVCVERARADEEMGHARCPSEGRLQSSALVPAQLGIGRCSQVKVDVEDYRHLWDCRWQ